MTKFDDLKADLMAHLEVAMRIMEKISVYYELGSYDKDEILTQMTKLNHVATVMQVVVEKPSDKNKIDRIKRE